MTKKLLASHRTVLGALRIDSDWEYLNFNMIVDRTDPKMDRSEVRRICRHLARKGWTEYGRGLWTEDGEPFGSGYRITELGAAQLEEPK